MSFQLKLALRYLLGRRLRSFLTILSIALGVMILFGLNGMLPAVQDSIRQNLMTSTSQVDLTVTGQTGAAFDAALVDVVRGTPGVAHASGSLGRVVVLPAAQAPKAASGQPVASLLLSGVDPATATEVRPLPLVKGRLLQAGDGEAMLISSSLADGTGLQPGDTLRLPSAAGSATFRIVGIVALAPTGGPDPVYVPLAAAQELLGLPGQVNTVEALLAPGADAPAVRQAVLERLGPNYKLGAAEGAANFQAAMQMGLLAIGFIGVLALAMGTFIIFNTFRTLVVERRHDIGMLRALGATRRTILGLILGESLLQGAIGTAIGMAAGYLMVSGLLAAIEPLAESMWHSTVGGPSFSARTFALSIGLGVGVSVLGGLLPALSAGRLTPLEALRPATGEVTWRAAAGRVACGAVLIGLALLGLVSGTLGLAALGALLFVAGLLVLGPALVQPIARLFGRLLALAFAREGRIAEGNLARQPGRAAITASTMMIGLAFLVATASLGTSLTSGIKGYLDQSLGADYLVMPQSIVLSGGNVGAGPQLLQSVRSTPGIAAAASLRLGTAKAGSVEVQAIGIDPVEYPRVSALVFTAGEPGKAYAELGAGRALIANGIFATQAGLKVGQELALQTPAGPQVYRVAGIGGDFINIKLATVFVSQANLAADFQGTGDVLLMANRARGADPAAVLGALQSLVQDYPAFTVFDSGVWRQAINRQFNAAFSLVYLLIAVVAVPSLIALVNTLSINVLERTREIGVLRAVGSTRGQVGRMILAESLLLAAIGTAFGLLTGLWLGYIMVGGLNVGGFVLPYFFPYTGVLVTIATGLLFGVLGALIPARHAARLDIVGALQYE